MELAGRESVADFSQPIREAVDETIFALAFGALLATLTVMVFLRRWPEKHLHLQLLRCL